MALDETFFVSQHTPRQHRPTSISKTLHRFDCYVPDRQLDNTYDTTHHHHSRMTNHHALLMDGNNDPSSTSLPSLSTITVVITNDTDGGSSSNNLKVRGETGSLMKLRSADAASSYQSNPAMESREDDKDRTTKASKIRAWRERCLVSRGVLGPEELGGGTTTEQTRAAVIATAPTTNTTIAETTAMATASVSVAREEDESSTRTDKIHGLAKNRKIVKSRSFSKGKKLMVKNESFKSLFGLYQDNKVTNIAPNDDDDNNNNNNNNNNNDNNNKNTDETLTLNRSLILRKFTKSKSYRNETLQKTDSLKKPNLDNNNNTDLDLNQLDEFIDIVLDLSPRKQSPSNILRTKNNNPTDSLGEVTAATTTTTTTTPNTTSAKPPRAPKSKADDNNKDDHDSSLDERDASSAKKSSRTIRFSFADLATDDDLSPHDCTDHSIIYRSFSSKKSVNDPTDNRKFVRSYSHNRRSLRSSGPGKKTQSVQAQVDESTSMPNKRKDFEKTRSSTNIGAMTEKIRDKIIISPKYPRNLSSPTKKL